MSSTIDIDILNNDFSQTQISNAKHIKDQNNSEDIEVLCIQYHTKIVDS